MNFSKNIEFIFSTSLIDPDTNILMIFLLLHMSDSHFVKLIVDPYICINESIHNIYIIK